MKRLEELTGKRFFDLFDFICGVSTGSIFICGMIADKNRTLDEGKEHYKDVSRKVFHLPGTFDMLSGTSRLMWTHAYYDVELWEKLLVEKMTERRIIDTSKEGCFPKVKKLLNFFFYGNLFFYENLFFSFVASLQLSLMKQLMLMFFAIMLCLGMSNQFIMEVTWQNFGKLLDARVLHQLTLEILFLIIKFIKMEVSFM